MNMLTMACLGGKVERGMGSLAFLGLNAALVLTTCLLETGLSWVIFKILPSEFYPLYYLTYTVGYSGVLFGLIVVDCANSPAVDRVLCCCPVPAWLYPWILFFAIQFAMGPLVSWIGHLSGIGCGYLYAKGLLNWCTLPMASLRTFENRPCLSGLVSYSRWARVPDASYIAGCQLPYTASWEGACCRGLDAQACRGLCSCCPSASALRSSVPPLQLPGSGRSLGGNRYHQVQEELASAPEGPAGRRLGDIADLDLEAQPAPAALSGRGDSRGGDRKSEERRPNPLPQGLANLIDSVETKAKLEARAAPLGDTASNSTNSSSNAAAQSVRGPSAYTLPPPPGERHESSDDDIYA